MQSVRGMILAAGLGNRLRPLTDERPKPLIEVLGKPLIYYALKNLQRAGATRVVINTHHLGEQIPLALGDSFEGIPLFYSSENPILGTGGALAQARDLLCDKDSLVLLINGDALIDLDVESLIKEHIQNKALATMVLKKVDHPEIYGVIGTDEAGRVRRLANIVPFDGPLTERMFCGVHLLSPEFFNYVPDEPHEFCILRTVYKKLMLEEKRIFGFDYAGYYCDAGTPERVREVNFEFLGQKEYIADSAVISDGVILNPPFFIDEETQIESGSIVGPFSIIGKKNHVGRNASVSRSVVFSGVHIHAGEKIHNGLVGREKRIIL